MSPITAREVTRFRPLASEQLQRRAMNDKFDELTRGLAQSVTRRGALKKFGLGLTGLALASLGLEYKAHAAPQKGFPCGHRCHHDSDCASANCYSPGDLGKNFGRCYCP